MMNRAVFLDRDGTLVEDSGYPCQFKPEAILPGAVEAVRWINHREMMAIIVTNQSAVARGICSEEDVRRFHEELTQYFRDHGAQIDAVYFCPYLPNGALPAYNCDHPWRKPQPGMLLAAAADWRLNLPDCFMIGDSPRDMQAGKRVGCRTIQVLTGESREPAVPEADAIATDITGAIRQIGNWIGI